MSSRLLPSPNCRKMLGNYEYYENKVIGRGTYSMVFEGRKVHSNQRVCVKKIHIKSATIDKLVRNEIDAMKKVNHNNVLKFITYFEKGSYIFIVTELCQMNLLSKIRQQGKMSQKEVLLMFLQIIQGYQEVRNRGYIHRDIKPENILVKEKTLKLADFGYCTLLKSPTIQDNFNIGTPLYMAPETLHNNVYSEKTDIWGFGITLYEMLSGQVPFISKTEEDLKKQLKSPVRSITCQPSVMKMITKCLAYNPENRLDLQRLLLEVKLILNEIKQKQTAQNIQINNPSISQICFNELNYITFLDYVKFLSGQTKNLNQSLKNRINFIFQFKIRMRIALTKPLFQDDQMDATQPQIKATCLQIQKQHQFQIPMPTDLPSNSRLHFFQRQKSYLKQSLQWQAQAQIKDLIIETMKQIGKPKTELSIAMNEDRIKLVDFLLSSFALNKILIQKNNSSLEFARLSNLSIILNSPCRIDLNVFEKIKKKANDLQIL